MEIRLAAGVGLVLLSMVLGACVCACKIAADDGLGCFARQAKYDQVVMIDGDSISSSSHDWDEGSDGEAIDGNLEMT